MSRDKQMIYRTPAVMPPKEKTMRNISEDEKREKTSSIESFRVAQITSFIVACMLLGGMVFHCMQLPDKADTTKIAERRSREAYSITLALYALGGLIISFGSTRRISKLQPFIETYWEQRSARETKQEHR